MRIVPLTPDSWEPLAALFREGGDPRWCYCQFWRLRSKDFAPLNVPPLRERLRAEAESDQPPGLVALETLDADLGRGGPAAGGPAARGSASERAIGWVGFGPRLDFQRIVHSKVIPAIDDRPVWSIVCFAIASGARGRGIGSALLKAAIEHARASGAPAIEAYPIALEPGEHVAAESAFTGTLPMFERAGFHVVADNAFDPSARHRRVVVRLELEGARLPR